MNIHRRAEQGSETSIDQCRNVSKNESFSIQVIKTLSGNGYKNGIKDNGILEYRL